MEFKELAQNVRKHISNAETHKAFSELTAYLQTQNGNLTKEILDDVIIIESLNNKLSKEVINGIISYEENLHRTAIINYQILEILKVIEQDDYGSSFSSHKERERWIEAVTSNDLNSYREFINSYPGSSKSKLADLILDELEDLKRLNDEERELWRSTDLALKKEPDLLPWSIRDLKVLIERYFNYLKNSKLKTFRDKANERILALEKQFWQRILLQKDEWGDYNFKEKDKFRDGIKWYLNTFSEKAIFFEDAKVIFLNIEKECWVQISNIEKFWKQYSVELRSEIETPQKSWHGINFSGKDIKEIDIERLESSWSITRHSDYEIKFKEHLKWFMNGFAEVDNYTKEAKMLYRAIEYEEVYREYLKLKKNDFRYAYQKVISYEYQDSTLSYKRDFEKVFENISAVFKETISKVKEKFEQTEEIKELIEKIKELQYEKENNLKIYRWQYLSENIGEYDIGKLQDFISSYKKGEIKKVDWQDLEDLSKKTQRNIKIYKLKKAYEFVRNILQTITYVFLILFTYLLAPILWIGLFFYLITWLLGC